MKTRELIVELERLATTHPDAELSFEFFDNLKGTTRTAGLVSAKAVHGSPTMLITDKEFVDEVRSRDT